MDSVVDRFEQETAGESFDIKRTAILQLEALDEEEDMNIALEKIKKAGLRGSMTIGQLLEKELAKIVHTQLPHMTDQTKQDIVWRILQKEGEAMLSAVPKGNRIVTLDIPGKKWDTQQLSQQLESWKLDGRDVSILIGGPEGLAPQCKAAAEQSWSLSALTLPHPLVRVIMAESLYRAWSLTTNHPYHRE